MDLQKKNHDSNPSGVVFLQRVDDYKITQARQLRTTMTPAEGLFWEHVRANRFMGLQFRRQQIIEGFIADFYCNKARCVVEVDGEIHGKPDQKKIDEHRKKVFESRGLSEIRFTNSEILHDINGVMERLKKAIVLLLATPFPYRRKGEVKNKCNCNFSPP